MAFDDLRSFLQALDDHGQLLKISEEVNAEPDLAAAANATGRIGDGAPALWFDNIRGFTDARVVMNTIGSWQNHAISMGLPANTPVKKQIDEFIRRKSEKAQHIIVQQLPHTPESFIHLDMVFTLLDQDKCMAFEPLILNPGSYQTVHIKIQNGKLQSIRSEKNLLSALKKLGMDLEPVLCGGSDDWNQEREQWHSGANFFAVGPGQVLGKSEGQAS